MCMLCVCECAPVFVLLDLYMREPDDTASYFCR